MVEDYPQVGFEGEVIDVKPKYARDFLIPNRLAVYDFPGVHNRLYPLLDEGALNDKKSQKSYDNLLEKLKKSHLQVMREPSTINNLVLKEALGFKEIADKTGSKYGLLINVENIKLDTEIIKFGFHTVPLTGVYHQQFPDKQIDFTLIVETVPDTKK